MLTPHPRFNIQTNNIRAWIGPEQGQTPVSSRKNSNLALLNNVGNNGVEHVSLVGKNFFRKDSSFYKLGKPFTEIIQ